MIQFGKYKGKTVEYVFLELEDYSYIVWMNKIGKVIDNDILITSKKICQEFLNKPSANELLNG